jgi:predicted transcriptional regulator
VQIVADLLTVVGSGNRKTRIMYQANLSFSLLTGYLDQALRAGLISELSENDGCYAVTSKGEEFLKKYSAFLSRNKGLGEQLQVMSKGKAMLQKHCVTKLVDPGSRSSCEKQVNFV